MKINKKNICLLSFTFVILSSSFYIIRITTKSDRLTEYQIDSLRSEYPICEEDPETVSIRKLSLDEWIDVADTFVYGKATGPVKHFNVTVDTGNTAFDAKLNANGINNSYEFFEYSLTIINDSEGIMKKGDTITISANSIFEEYYPKMTNGKYFVVPVRKDPKAEERYTYTADGMFYVTDDGYVLSAFEENSIAKNSGLKVDDLLENLKKK